MIRTLFMIRGLPGSGKSTLAERLRAEFEISFFEADMFFSRTGEYRFNSDDLSLAHKWCHDAVCTLMHNGKSVSVSNTFTTYDEIRVYLAEAFALDYRVVVVHCTGNFGNVHAVPEETIRDMRARWLSNVELGNLVDDKRLLTCEYGGVRGQFAAITNGLRNPTRSWIEDTR